MYENSICCMSQKKKMYEFLVSGFLSNDRTQKAQSKISAQKIQKVDTRDFGSIKVCLISLLWSIY